jgi:site-specific DNA recombinase
MDVVVSNLVNTMYCRDAGKKLRTANQVKWRKGITTASAAPFGYQFDPDKKGAYYYF